MKCAISLHIISLCIYAGSVLSVSSHEVVIVVRIVSHHWLLLLCCEGALTRGDRRAATGADLMEFNFDTPYGRTALRTVYSAVCQVAITQLHI